ncbi:MAG: radical SAM protein [Deltaproteobacteria bacterium]|nr:radical SAM protein [Deltaproteobacteria bacterium]
MPGPVYKFLYHKLAAEPRRWHPMLSVYYLTYACDFRCPYCSDGAQNPYYKLRSGILPADRVIALLRNVRACCDHLVITGGEPLKHPEFARIVDGLGEVRFRGLVLTTNGHDLEPHLEPVVRTFSQLVFSVDTLDRGKSDQWHGVGPGSSDRIFATIDRADRVRPSSCEIVISAVVTPDNIADLHEVYAWARDRGFAFAACPQLVGVKAHAELVGNPAYKALFDMLIAEKRAARRVFGTVPYLERMRDLSRFRCRPLTMLVVSPIGDVFYPCLERGSFAGNLLDTPDLHALLEAGRREHGSLPTCDVQCHSACALGFATVLDKPWAVAQEAWLSLRAT